MERKWEEPKTTLSDFIILPGFGHGLFFYPENQLGSFSFGKPYLRGVCVWGGGGLRGAVSSTSLTAFSPENRHHFSHMQLVKNRAARILQGWFGLADRFAVLSGELLFLSIALKSSSDTQSERYRKTRNFSHLWLCLARK